MGVFAVAGDHFRDFRRQPFHRLVLAFTGQLFRRERERVIEGHRSKSGGNFPPDSADGAADSYHCGVIHDGTRKTHWSTKSMLLIAVGNVLDTNISLL